VRSGSLELAGRRLQEFRAKLLHGDAMTEQGVRPSILARIFAGKSCDRYWQHFVPEILVFGCKKIGRKILPAGRFFN
jgi:hypothetical protein